MRGTWVLDCSAAAAFLLNESPGGELDELMVAAGSGEAELVVPALFWSELVNVLVMAERRGRLSRELAVRLRSETDLLPVTTDAEVGAVERRRTHEFAVLHDLTAYDAAYLELADRRGARLRTLDPDLLALRREYSWIE